MSTVTDEGLLAALSAGIDNGGSTPAPAEETIDEKDDATGAGEGTTGDEAGAGEDGNDSAAGGTEGEQSGDGADDAAGEGGEEGEGAGDGRERDPATGKFLPKKKDGEEPAKADGPAIGPDGKPVAKAAAPGVKDPVNDPIPQGLKKETQERMVALVQTAKTLTAERDQYKTQYTEIMGYIQESKATPEQYGQALDYLRMVNSGDPAQIEKCIQFMQTELAALSKLTGKPVAGVDLLTEHADLAQKVRDGALSREDAEELAAARNHRNLRTDHARYTQEQNTAAERAKQERQQYMADLNTLEGELMAQDTQYAAKRPSILKALQTKNPATGKTLIESTPPAQWQALFLKHYALAKVPPAPKTTVNGQGGSNVPRNQPLRAKQPAGGAAPAAKSGLDALNQALASMG